MRRLILALTLALTPAMASAATLAVGLDQAVRVSLRSTAQDVIVGNPAIADVTVSDPQHLIVVGKTAGVTNLIVINPAGRAIINEQVVVGSASAGHVTVISGTDTQEYACGGSCEKTGQPTDPQSEMSDAMSKLFTKAMTPASSSTGAAAQPSPTQP